MSNIPQDFDWVAEYLDDYDGDAARLYEAAKYLRTELTKAKAVIASDTILAAEASMAWSILTGQDPQQTRAENACVAAARDFKEKHDALVSGAKALCREVANHGEPKDEVLEALEACRAALWRSES